MARTRARVIWVMVATAAVVIALFIGFAVGRSGATSIFPAWLTGSDVPRAGRAEAAEAIVPSEGVEVTIKQRKSAWLPGGEYRLHLDDITGGQVLVSATDRRDHAIFGPTSVREGDVLQLPNRQQPTLNVKVVRLVNLLTGEDFGVFLVTR